MLLRFIIMLVMIAKTLFMISSAMIGIIKMLLEIIILVQNVIKHFKVARKNLEFHKMRL